MYGYESKIASTKICNPVLREKASGKEGKRVNESTVREWMKKKGVVDAAATPGNETC